MPDYIKTKADIERGLTNWPDDGPVMITINGVATKAYWEQMGESDERQLIVEPNYTCAQPKVFGEQVR